MYEEIKSIDISDEMKTNDLYYLFKTNSSQINLEILSKIQKYTTLTEFFKHYIKKDVKTINDSYDNFIGVLSTFSNENNKLLFDSQLDQYISDFSYIYKLFSILIKLKDSLASLLLNIKTKLSNLYNVYHIDKNKQEKIDEFIACLFDVSQNKNNTSKCSTKDNSLDNNINCNCFYDKRESYDNSKLEQRLIEDLLGKERNNMKLESISNTPRFNTINNMNKFKSSPTYVNENNYLNNSNDEKQSKKCEIIVHQESTDSEFTLSPHKKKKKNKEKEKEKEKENTANNNDNINKNKVKDNINEVITNINKNDFIIKNPQKRRNTSYIKKYNSKVNLYLYKTSDGNNMKALFSSYKDNNKIMINNKDKKDLYRKIHTSSGHLFMREESKMYTELLEIIKELYKKNKINMEQKLKLKKLIICKSPKILNIYKSFNNDDDEDDELINKLKEIIQ